MNRNAKLLEKIYEYEQLRNGTVTPSIVIIIFPLYEVAAQLRRSIFLSMLMRVLWLINPTGAHSLRKIFDGINKAWAELNSALFSCYQIMLMIKINQINQKINF